MLIKISIISTLAFLLCQEVVLMKHNKKENSMGHGNHNHSMDDGYTNSIQKDTDNKGQNNAGNKIHQSRHEKRSIHTEKPSHMSMNHGGNHTQRMQEHLSLNHNHTMHGKM